MTKSAFAYLDESGDLGWKLDLPYQEGGSSRYFVIAIVVGFNQSYRRFGKVVETLHEQQKWTSNKEKKWATIGPHARRFFCQLAAKELASNPETHVFAAVYHKETAPDYLRTVDVRAMNPEATELQIQKLEAQYRGRTHLVYAMMVAETLAAHLPPLDTFTYCPDELNEGQRTLESIVTYRLLIQNRLQMGLKRVDRKQPMQKGLDFADMVAGAVWEAYEHSDRSFFNIIEPYITVKNFTDKELYTNSLSGYITRPAIPAHACAWSRRFPSRPASVPPLRRGPPPSQLCPQATRLPGQHATLLPNSKAARALRG